MKRLLKFSGVPLLLAGLLAILLGRASLIHAAPVSKATSASSCQWSMVASPNVGSKTNDGLNGVAAIAANDVWAVGDYAKADGAVLALAEHWNGTQWSIVPTPNLHIGGIVLEAVSADATNDVWAVGDSGRVRSSTNTLIEHWNGTQWSIISSPNAGVNNNLDGVAAIAPNNVWAVGEYNNGEDVLIEHWDGTQWSVVPGVNPSNIDNTLYSVSAVSANDVWTVGSANMNGKETTLTEHWDGTSWSVVNSPNNQDPLGDIFLSVSASSASNVWAVGNSVSNHQTLIERWNGTKWSLVPGLSLPPNKYVDLNGVVALSSSNVWMAGDRNIEQQTLIGHWNGTRWNVVNSPSPGTQGNILQGIASVPGTNQLWSVGDTGNLNEPGKTLTERYC